MNKTANVLVRLIILCIGLCIIGLGGSLFIFSNFGSDPFNLQAQGLSRVSGLSIGTINVIVQAVIFLFLLCVWREKIGVGTFFATFVIGGSLNVWSKLLTAVFGDPGLAVRIVFVLIASFIIGFGVAIVQLVDLGMVPNDILPIYLFRLQKRFQFRVVRIFYDSVQLVVGVLLGGVLGIGTVLCALLTGPAIQASLNLLRKLNCPYLQNEKEPAPAENA